VVVGSEAEAVAEEVIEVSDDDETEVVGEADEVVSAPMMLTPGPKEVAHSPATPAVGEGSTVIVSWRVSPPFTVSSAVTM
jgi:hypothetical protein